MMKNPERNWAKYYLFKSRKKLRRIFNGNMGLLKALGIVILIAWLASCVAMRVNKIVDVRAVATPYGVKVNKIMDITIQIHNHEKLISDLKVNMGYGWFQSHKVISVSTCKVVSEQLDCGQLAPGANLLIEMKVLPTQPGTNLVYLQFEEGASSWPRYTGVSAANGETALFMEEVSPAS